MMLAVGPAARAMYLGAVTMFERWTGRRLARAIPVNDDHLLDHLLAHYIDTVFPRNTLLGLIFIHSPPKGMTTLPRARMALAGFLTVQTAQARNPCPWETATILIMWLCSEPHKLTSCLAGLAFLLNCDLYLRPSETLALCRAAVIPPFGRMKQFTPHTARHGGPNVDAFARTFDERQGRAGDVGNHDLQLQGTERQNSLHAAETAIKSRLFATLVLKAAGFATRLTHPPTRSA